MKSTSFWSGSTRRILVAAIFACLSTLTIRAEVFAIDPARSGISLSGSALGFALQEQGAGSLATRFAGTIHATATDTTITFPGASLIAAQNSGNWEPKAKGESGNEPANFGGKASAGVLGSVLAAVRNSQFDATSAVLPLGGGLFDSGALRFQFVTGGSGVLDYNVAGLLATKGSIPLTGLATNRVTAQASVVTSGGVQTLTLPITADFFFRLLSANDTKLTITGQIVATRTVNAGVAGDSFTDRVLANTYPLRLAAANTGATKEPGEPNHGGNAGGHSLWWGWTAPVAGEVTVTTAGSDFDTLLAVYTGNTLASLTTIDSQDRGQTNERITFHAAAGAAYNIALDGFDGKTGNAVVNLTFIPSPANDDFARRALLTGTDVSLVASNVAATFEPGEPRHVNKSGGKSVWWSWTPAATGPALISTEGSAFDTLLAVYTGASVTNLVEVASRDLALGDTVAFEAVAGTAYQIAVDGYNGGEGGFPLRLMQSAYAPLSFSAFDQGVDFWTVVSLPDTGPYSSIVGGPFVPAFVSTNGNPGGHLSQSDPDGSTWFWNAPTKLLGDQSIAYGGFLNFELRQSATDNQFPAADVVLVGGGNVLVLAQTNYPGTNWTSYQVPLSESAGWRKDNLAGTIPTRAEFQAVLRSLNALRIRGEYRNGEDTGDLDNVAWSGPSSEVLFDNGNVFGVQSGPRVATTFTLPRAAVITYVQDYHYFNNSVLPGTIGLRHSDGTLYGPWQADGLPGQGGVANAYWVVEPMIQVNPGTYTVVDSDPATWSHNSASGFAGFTLVKGYFLPETAPELRIMLETDGMVAVSWPATATGFVLLQSPAISPVLGWTLAPEQPVLESGRFVVRLRASPGNAFYRLTTTVP
jgi:hypothetical protein